MVKIFENIKNKEPGSSLDYVTYFLVIMVTFIIFAFSINFANIAVAKDEIELGIQTAENAMLSYSFSGANSEYQYNVESRKMMIVANSQYDSSAEDYVNRELSGIELQEVTAIGNEFSRVLTDHLALADQDGSGKVHPTTTALMSLCGSNGSILLETLTIYEPIYVVSSKMGYDINGDAKVDVWIKKQHTEEPGVVYKYIKCEEGSSIWEPTNTLPKKLNGSLGDVVSFVPEYSIKKWIEYDLSYNSRNTLSGITKKPLDSAPILHNGHVAEGATFEAKITTTMYGMVNIFSQEKATVAAPNDDSVPKALFASPPTRQAIPIEIWKAVDIVPAHLDKRTIRSTE